MARFRPRPVIVAAQEAALLQVPALNLPGQGCGLPVGHTLGQKKEVPRHADDIRPDAVSIRDEGEEELLH